MTGSITDIFTGDRASLAPLAGVTDSVFRRICARFGARPVMTEMVSAMGYLRGKPGDKTARLLRFHETERPIGFQFFGSDPESMRDAVQRAQERRPDFIDINAGCPVKKVITKGSGSALMRNSALLVRIVAAVAGGSKVPVTVKIRSGWDSENINAVEVAKRCADSGAQAIIVHPRTRSQGFSGVSDWSVIRAVKEAVQVPVVGSGDVKTADDFLRMRRETGCDFVMVGRAAMYNPMIFREISPVKHQAEGEKYHAAAGVAERLELGLEQLRLLTEEVSGRFALLNMRKFFGWYSHGARNGASFRRSIFRAESLDEVEEIIRNFQAECKAVEELPVGEMTHVN